MSEAPPTEPPPERKPQSEDERVRIYRCPHCGQTFFAFANEPLPHMCAYCQDMTTWEPHEPPTP